MVRIGVLLVTGHYVVTVDVKMSQFIKHPANVTFYRGCLIRYVRVVDIIMLTSK